MDSMTDQPGNNPVDDIILSIAYEAGLMPRGKTISVNTFHQQKAAIQRYALSVAREELEKFEPLQRNHDKCIDSMSCIGYQNAASDFDNEKEIRLAELDTRIAGEGKS